MKHTQNVSSHNAGKNYVRNGRDATIKNSAAKAMPGAQAQPAPVEVPSDKVEISSAAKELAENKSANKMEEPGQNTLEKAVSTAKDGIKHIRPPVPPVAMPDILPKTSAAPVDKEVRQIADKARESLPVRKPGVFFIHGLELLSGDDEEGVRAMAKAVPDSKLFSWRDGDEIMKEIKRRTPDQPVVLIGYGFGGDTALKVANKLNSTQNAFRSVDLLVTIDAIGITKNDVIPQNVKTNLNFIADDGPSVFTNGPHVARNTSYTNVINELRPEGHGGLDRSTDVQFKIFNKISDILGDRGKFQNFAAMNIPKDAGGPETSVQ